MAPVKKVNPANEESSPLSDDERFSVDWAKERKKEREERSRLLTQMSKDLSEPFAHEVEKVLKKGGASLIYIPVSEVINRLNKVFGFDGWSSEIIKCERDQLDPDFVVACVRLTTFIDGDRFGTVSKEGYGGQKIKRMKTGDIVDLGDEFKGAVSDALKKAAQQFGIGLYLARSEEALGLDEVEEEAAAVPQVSEMYVKFKTFLENFTAEQKGEIKDFWAKASNGRPTPKPHEFTDNELKSLIAECVRIQFGGVVVDESNND